MKKLANLYAFWRYVLTGRGPLAPTADQARRLHPSAPRHGETEALDEVTG
jgi:hypothetical protein